MIRDMQVADLEKVCYPSSDRQTHTHRQINEQVGIELLLNQAETVSLELTNKVHNTSFP